MDDKTKQMLVTVGAGLARKVLMLQAAGLVSHGIISSNYTEMFVSLGMAGVGAAWSFWNDFGRAIALSQLEIWKAKSLAEAAKLRDAGIAPVTTTQIADQSPTLTAAQVTKTLPAAASSSVIHAVLAALLLAGLAFPDVARAQTRQPLTGNLVKDIAAATGKPATAVSTAASTDSAVGTFGDSVRKITKELVDKAIADVTAASADAEKHNDMISKPCWDANLKLLQGLPSQWENPPTDIGIALGIQIQRDLLNSITGNDVTSLKVACAALWGDQLKIVANVAALLGVRIATGGLL